MLRFVQRQGNYHYFRKVGCKSVRLPGAEGSPEYLAAYERALAGRNTVELTKLGFVPGSLGWADRQIYRERGIQFEGCGHASRLSRELARAARITDGARA